MRQPQVPILSARLPSVAMGEMLCVHNALIMAIAKGIFVAIGETDLKVVLCRSRT
jgi:hypothetical protein